MIHIRQSVDKYKDRTKRTHMMVICKCCWVEFLKWLSTNAKDVKDSNSNNTLWYPLTPNGMGSSRSVSALPSEMFP